MVSVIFRKHVSNYVSNFNLIFMKQNNVHVKIVPDIRRIKTASKFPLKLRITYKGERKYYATGLDASPEQWDAINSAEVKGKFQKMRIAMAEIERRALDCVASIVPFSFLRFEREFFRAAVLEQTVEMAYEGYIEVLKANEQYGTAQSYWVSCNALKRFRPGKLQFEDVTKEFLNDFEKWMVGKGRSLSTVGIYLRPLRTIFNIAIERGSVRPELYPFGRRKYIIPTGRNVKRALDIDQIRQIFHYQAEPGSSLEKAKDFWMFSYLCNGMNMADIARLRWSNVSPETISFQREKTKRTKRDNPITIVVVRNHQINALIQKWGRGEARTYNGYLFDILELTDQGEPARLKVELFTHFVNEWMKGLGKDLGFGLNLTTYVARHSFATILVRSGAPLAMAKQTLGHASIATTEKYFAGFDLAAQAEYTKALVNF
jgi:integrase/recombinase XerD